MKNPLAAITIFIGSFLIFGIQPMVGRTLLPVFGGTAAVWVVCLCAFQVFLLGGYWYADWLAKNGKAPKIRRHLSLLAVAALWTVVVALYRGSWLGHLGGAAGGAASLEVLLCVFCLVGVPYMLLGSNSSLVQVFAGGDYKLYSVSNAGSLLGLLAYPFLFEPCVSLTAQWLGFAAGIAVYAVLLWRLAGKSVVCKVRSAEGSAGCEVRSMELAGTNSALSTQHSALLYFLLPAASCFLLDALTTHVTLDVMPMPLMWTASLGLFLLSYIVGFSGKAEKLVKPFAVLTCALFVVLCWMNGKTIAKIGLPAAMAAYGAFLFFACTFLHSWLYAIRPSGEKLTRYYLFQSIGGAIGGVVASLAFPFLTKTILEYPVSLFGIGVMACVGLFIARTGREKFVLVLKAALAIAVLSGGTWLYIVGFSRETRPCIYRGRGFFGTIEVLEAKARTSAGEGRVHEYVHGTTVHGIQALIPGKTKMPTVYYTPNACGYGIVSHPKYRSGEPMRVNIIGLGVGVQMSYGRANDYYRAYEISEDALKVATDTNLFTFVSECPAKKDIILGDARKGLEAELTAGVEPYDVICVDAFTGDNLPYHLSTVEAFELYFKLLKPNGVIVVNISNWHLNLLPFMCALGDHFGCPLLGLRTKDDFGRLQFNAIAAVFCRDPTGYAPPPLGPYPTQATMIDFTTIRPMPTLPTDEKGSFISLIRW